MPYETKKHLRDEAKRLSSNLQIAKAGGMREALKLVINALELREYQRGFPISITSEPDVMRFKADLETALRVREEKAKAAADQATADKVSKLNYISASEGIAIDYPLGDESTYAEGSWYGTASTYAAADDVVGGSIYSKPAKNKKKSKGDKK